MTHACSSNPQSNNQSPYNERRRSNAYAQTIQRDVTNLDIASDATMSSDIVQYSNPKQLTNFCSPQWDQFQTSSKGANSSIPEHTRAPSSHSNSSYVALDQWSDFPNHSDAYQHSNASSLESMNRGHELVNVQCLQNTGASGSTPQYGAFRPVVITPPPSDKSGPISPRSQWSSDLVAQLEKKQPVAAVRSKSHKHAAIRSDGGIRKKNSKVEIPPGVTLDNLDYLIETAGTEDELRELKTQKRLLRNREAALHSRQKKKVHTEDLERQTTQLTAYVTQLELERDNWQRQAQQIQVQLQHQLTLHKQESDRFRNEISHLQLGIQSPQAGSVSDGQSSAEYRDYPNSTIAGSMDHNWSQTLDMNNNFCSNISPNRLHQHESSRLDGALVITT